MEAYVHSEIKDKVGIVEFFHPASNSLPGVILDKIAQEILKMDEEEEVKVILLKSGGDRAFCAGASFDELIAIDNKETGLAFFTGFAKVINAIREVSKFVIVRVQGKVVGGGVGIAAAGDYTFATKHAAIKLSELAVGIGPFVVGPAVERKMGLSAFTQLTINAKNFQSAEWAHTHGLYAGVYENAEEMDEAINGLLEDLKGSNPEAMKELKKVFWQGTENWSTLLKERAAISGELVLSEFTRNAINEFKKK
ncbi:MAG TPA: enoyl-CoA hydratase-related protein [Chitinophagaceae bacterium]|nr:enoyl-CoA hydratase-related protein [Chitinophagaceae bacterium]